MENQTNIKKIILGTLAFVVVSFVVQASNHFVISREHYAGISFMRKEPIMALGIFTMLLQGAILSYLFSFFYKNGETLMQGLKYGLLMGAFLGSYIVLVEPGKYTVPSVSAWIAVEGIASLLQFSLFGITLGAIYKRRAQ